MSPSDAFGELLKPFVFLDLFDNGGKAFEVGLHPHSGIATLTYVLEGSMNYEDPSGTKGMLPGGGAEWMQAGGGMWHNGGLNAVRTRGFQLWIALPPSLETAPYESKYLSPETIQTEGPAGVLLGTHGAATSPIKTPSPINYLCVRLNAGEEWTYQPPPRHTVLWVALAFGKLSTADIVSQGELVAFEPSNDAIVLKALADAEFVIGSAVPHHYELVLGHYSVHTSAEALRDGEARIATIRTKLVREGRL
jgi:redox-sensitive bicupin YhaK (pirin superfamily)